jgi:hypothetical protein
VFALAAALQPVAADLPGFPSIVLLVKDGPASALFTGNAPADAILSGLARQGQLEADGTIRVDVLQVPASPASLMIRREFFRNVVGDHYLFAGNGENGEPSADLIEALFAARSATPTSAGPFTLWFSSDLDAAESERNADVEALRSLLDLRINASGGRARCRFLARTATALQINIGTAGEIAGKTATSRRSSAKVSSRS